jgi:hypothetical protein
LANGLFGATLLKLFHMKKTSLLLVVMMLAGFFSMAQEPALADKGVTYGAGTTADGAVPVNELTSKMKAGKFNGKVSGKVVSVCLEKGCWMKVEKADGESMMVKFKDYGFFMPKNIVGKEVVLDGEAAVKETSVKQLKHYAEDAGKSKEEIEKIKTAKKELTFTAKGVLVM